MKQKYNSIVRRHKTLREKRSVGVAAGTRDHLVNRVEDTLRQMNHSLGTREGEGKRGRLGDREGLIRRWFPRVAHDASDGRSMPLVVTRWCWWWCYGRLCLAFHSRSTNRDERLHARLLATVRLPALPFPFLSFPFPSLPLFSLSFRPFQGHLSSTANPLFSRNGFPNYHLRAVRSSSLVDESRKLKRNHVVDVYAN